MGNTYSGFPKKSESKKTAQTGVCLKNWPGLAHAQAVSNRQKNPNLKQMLVVSEDSTFAIPGSYKKKLFFNENKDKEKIFLWNVDTQKTQQKGRSYSKRLDLKKLTIEGKY